MNKKFNDLLSKYKLESFNSLDLAHQYINDFGLEFIYKRDRIHNSSNSLEKSSMEGTVSPSADLFGPDFRDLCRLHWLCVSRKVFSVLEFGSGYSSAVMGHAMKINFELHAAWAKENIRNVNPFHVFSLEEEQRYLDTSLENIPDELGSFVTILRSSVELEIINERIVTLYKSLPNITPDFIYLDGPSQFAATSNVNGFSIDLKSRMPMAADILRFEYFLEPGTLILVDGRTANARFLKANLQQSWAYHHDQIADVHYFELQEAPLGEINRKKIEYTLNNQWLLG
jgi:hypothetical protein